MSIIVDDEFKSLIPPLTPDEFAQLEQNCVAEGIRDALVVWPQGNGDSILIDGHNRFAIASRHGGIQFRTVEKQFADRNEAMLWIIDNQLGRRSLSLFDRVILEDRKREFLAKQAKTRQSAGGGDKRSDSYKESVTKKSCEPISNTSRRENTTDYKIAKAAGTSEDTVRKVRAINEKASDRTKELIREGKLSINQGYNSVAPKRPDPAKKALSEHLAFQEAKQSDVVSIQDAKRDKENQRLLDADLAVDVRKLLSDIDKFRLKHSNLSQLHEIISDETDRKVTLALCKACINTLAAIQQAIMGD